MTRDTYLTAAEVAEIVRETPDTIRRRCAAGQIRATKLGDEWRIAESDLVLFMTPGKKSSPRKRLTERQRRALGMSA